MTKRDPLLAQQQALSKSLVVMSLSGEVIATMRVGWLGEPKAELTAAANFYNTKGYRLLLWPHSQGIPQKASEPVLRHYEIDPDYDFPHPSLLPAPPDPARERPAPPTQTSLF
jgi:hypothetical protein